MTFATMDALAVLGIVLGLSLGALAGIADGLAILCERSSDEEMDYAGQ